MSEHIVVSIFNGDTFGVRPEWSRDGQTGSLVRPAGFAAAELGTADGEFEKELLAHLLLNQSVQPGSTRGMEDGHLICNVFYKGHNVAEHLNRGYLPKD